MKTPALGRGEILGLTYEVIKLTPIGASHQPDGHLNSLRLQMSSFLIIQPSGHKKVSKYAANFNLQAHLNR